MSTTALPTQELGPPIKGPTALGSDPRRFIRLTRALAVTDFKLRFFGSVLGYLWQLLRPLMLFGVLLLVFTQFVPLGKSINQYPVVLLQDIVIVTFFADATIGSVGSLVDRENLVRKIHFPRMVIPLSVVLTAYFNFLLNYVVVMIFALARGVAPRLSWLELPLLLVFTGVLVTGVAMLLSSLYVRFRDVRPIWEVVAQALFYGSPVIYVIDHLQHRSFRKPIMMNPIADVLTQARRAVVDPHAPSAAYVMGGGAWLAIPVGSVVVVFVLGFWFFNREAPRIAEQL